jgi:hypothetical protein
MLMFAGAHAAGAAAASTLSCLCFVNAAEQAEEINLPHPLI